MLPGRGEESDPAVAGGPEVSHEIVLYVGAPGPLILPRGASREELKLACRDRIGDWVFSASYQNWILVWS